MYHGFWLEGKEKIVNHQTVYLLCSRSTDPLGAASVSIRPSKHIRGYSTTNLSIVSDGKKI
jgi:hypothetical protein